MLVLTLYFKPKDGLPNHKGPLSLLITSQAIALANRKIATKGYYRQEQETRPIHTAAVHTFFLINVVALNTAGSFEFFHDDEVVHVQWLPHTVLLAC